MAQRTELQVDRHAIGNTRIIESTEPELGEGQVRCEIEFFALTANNITYAKFGDMLAYWDFYPVTAEWGHVPCMGYGRVTQSNVEGIEVGQRFHSWWPMATSVDITATPSEGGFRDDGPHRAPHAAVYRNFSRTDLDQLATTAEDETRHPLLRGLFTTGFLADAFFAADHYLGAEQAIVLSASSKTGIAFAAAAKATGMVRLVGVTSASNVDFVRDLGIYDEVLTYADVADVAKVPSVVVDMAGNGDAVVAIHRALGDLIAYSMLIGKSHHDAAPAMVDAGPTPEMFFAPGAVADRIAEWGHEGYVERISEATASFVDASRSWLSIDERRGVAAAQAAWTELHAGDIGPATGLIVSLQP